MELKCHNCWQSIELKDTTLCGFAIHDEQKHLAVECPSCDIPLVQVHDCYLGDGFECACEIDLGLYGDYDE